MKDTLMMAVQITPAEREKFRKIARSKGMMMQGLLAQLVRDTIKDSEPSSVDSDPSHSHFGQGMVGDIRDNATL